jgi:hypothetical protein
MVNRQTAAAGEARRGNQNRHREERGNVAIPWRTQKKFTRVCGYRHSILSERFGIASARCASQ